MASLTAWRFSSTEGADDAVLRLTRLDEQDLIDVEDAAVIRWPQYASIRAQRSSDGGACAGRKPEPSQVPAVIVVEFTEPAVAAAAVPSWTNSRVTSVPAPALRRFRRELTRFARQP